MRKETAQETLKTSESVLKLGIKIVWQEGNVYSGLARIFPLLVSLTMSSAVNCLFRSDYEKVKSIRDTQSAAHIC